MKRVAECNCGSPILEVGRQGEEIFWAHRDMVISDRQNCDFVDGSEREVSEEEYELILKGIQGNAGDTDDYEEEDEDGEGN